MIISTTRFNKLGIDNTKWYTIDYEKLAEIGRTSSRPQEKENDGDDCQGYMTRPCGQNDQTIWSKCPDHLIKMTTPLPETTTEITTEREQQQPGAGREAGVVVDTPQENHGEGQDEPGTVSAGVTGDSPESVVSEVVAEALRVAGVEIDARVVGALLAAAGGDRERVFTAFQALARRVAARGEVRTVEGWLITAVRRGYQPEHTSREAAVSRKRPVKDEKYAGVYYT